MTRLREAELLIAGVWADVLGRDRIEVHEDFFALGGRSLQVAKVIDRIRRLTGVALDVRAFFETPTVAGLAQQVAAGPHEVPAGQFAGVIELRRGRASGRPIFCIHPIGGLAWCYSAILPYVDPGHPVHGIQATERNGGLRPVRELADRYAGLVRSTHPGGPYVIAGWSLGGVLAYEVAGRIEAAGQRVDLVAIFDARPHDAPPSPDGYTGPAVCISASRTIERLGCPELAWKAYLPDAGHHTVEAEHDTMMTEEVMRQAGPILRAALARLPGP
ncbi:thioesterase domain-containing protein [Nonomuraea sp. NPDC050404]|uniref:thioesterase domain-containing protein n=1 Tax=Nonomuraea sp. NPDC050404 TaxID=3155783 RepID=UPI003400B451